MNKYILLFLMLSSFAIPAYAGDAIVVAANLGSQLGKATYCGFETDEFASLSGKTLDSMTSGNASLRSQAIQQFITAATMAAKSGPVVETCDEFNKGFEGSLEILKNQKL